jgi:uncharacterized protein YceK
MNTKKKIVTIITVSLALGVTLNFSGCSKEMSPIGPEQSGTKAEVSMAKPKALSIATETDITIEVPVSNYLQTGSIISSYRANKDEYRGNTLVLPNGSSFSFSNGALTPPPEIPYGQDVEITMTD